jgi:hypothetical protein
VVTLIRHCRAFPANAREAVDGETPAAWATCSSVTGPFAIDVFSREKLQNSLAQSIVHCHNNLRQAKNQ